MCVAHNEICWAYKELCEVQCLKMYRFLQYTLWLKVHGVLFCHLGPDFLYMSTGIQLHEYLSEETYVDVFLGNIHFTLPILRNLCFFF